VEPSAPVAPSNEEAVEAWNGPLFDRFVAFRDLVTTGLGAHGERALALHPPTPGDRALDVGCGFGDTAQRLAELVGPDGEVVGIDAAERFIEVARREAEEAGATNTSFLVGDVQVTEFGEPFDYAFSRFGTMFFANPVAALRNVRLALAPGGRLCSVVWRRKLDNDWLHSAEVVVSGFLERNEESDEPTCGPGPFSMADADTTSSIVQAAGFEQVSLTRCDIDIKIGDDVDGAMALVMALGPAGELIRLAGAEGERVRPQIEAALREALSEFDGPSGVYAPASTWIVSARAPEA
jgi:ubiquinone/menaquinone biosynthesis C-methylase UbiE